MTPKEALRRIKKSVGNHGWFEYEEIEAIEQALNELERLKKFKETFDNYELSKKQDFIAYENWLECEAELDKTPTADEVCKALSEHLGHTIVTRKNKHGITFNYVNTGKKLISTNYNLVNITVQLPPHIITMIGRFYEGLEK